MFRFLIPMIVPGSTPPPTSWDSFECAKNGRLLVKFIGEETDVVIPYGVTEIDKNAFDECGSLTSIVIPESVVILGSLAFCDCISLKSATIPESVHGFVDILYFSDMDLTYTIYLANPFRNCPALTEWRLSPSDPCLTSEGITLLSKDGSTLIACPAASGEYRVPDGVTEIRSYAFSDCTALTSVILPEGLTEIGFYAFEDCTSLTSIVLPKGLTKICEGAFKGCESLTSVEIPYGVEEIGPETFKGCRSLTSVEIPYGVTIIDRETFKGCTSLESIEIPESVEEIQLWAFKDCPNLTIYAPANSEAERYAKEKEIPFKDRS